jgi:hypothetical protein
LSESLTEKFIGDSLKCSSFLRRLLLDLANDLIV